MPKPNNARYGAFSIAQEDKTAFAERVLEVMGEHADIASEALWQALPKVLMEYWLVFQSDQSPMSTWAMVSKCTETVLKIRMAAKSLKGEGSADALEQFRQFMGEVLEEDAPESRERPG